jgi:hypothetical protein
MRFEVSDPKPSSRSEQAFGTGGSRPAGWMGATTRPHLPAALRSFLDRVNRIHSEPGMGGLAKPYPTHPPEVVPVMGMTYPISMPQSACAPALPAGPLATSLRVRRHEHAAGEIGNDADQAPSPAAIRAPEELGAMRRRTAPAR